ncbi:MAG TPA: hypothetical protein VEH27_00660 [Methylomirabilota bacterium]|nr:hypothetical protein [Methylomirabilota bacterium]
MNTAYAEPTMFRGDYKLPNQAQYIRQDIDGLNIERHLGKRVHGYRPAAEQENHRLIKGLDYRFIINAPESASLSWVAFKTSGELQTFMQAYGIRIEPDREPQRGETFYLVLPDSVEAFMPLTYRPV